MLSYFHYFLYFKDQLDNYFSSQQVLWYYSNPSDFMAFSVAFMYYEFLN